MRKLLTFYLIFIIFGVLFAGELPGPKVIEGSYDIAFRKGKTFFVDFNYEVKIKCVSKPYKAWLKVVLYDIDGNELESFGKQIEVETKKKDGTDVQVVYGTKMITLARAKEISQVGFDLGIYQKKY